MSAAQQLIVTLTTEQLSQLVEASAAKAIEKLVANQQDEVLDLEGCASLLKRSEDVVMRVLVKQKALPVHYISSREPRFVRREVLEWLSTLPTEIEKGIRK